ncbi:hypothetical protein AB0420_00090 [Streptomyces caelestis]|uniref:Uncharacterized protein n=1 Tax=Streptomyces heliomycini TaxID=284032 RepID=A0ABV5LAL4_9ACTN|nr:MULTISPECIES: hypothetical protein [Streptomyces]
MSEPRVRPLLRQLGAEHAHSGAGSTLQELTAAVAAKDSGLVEPLADALDEIIDNGAYAKVLER